MIGTIGEMVIVENEIDFAIKNVGLFKTGDEKLSKWIYYYLKSPEAQKEIEASLKGSTQQYISLTDLRNFPIQILPTNQRNQIIEILSSLDDKIELNNQINQNLEALAQALFKQWFVDFEFPNENGEPYKSSGGEMIDSELGEIPKGWRVGMLEEVIEFSNGYSFKSSELLDEDLGNCFHVFKMGHIKKGGGLNAEGTKSYFEKDKTSKLGKYVLKIGDLLMCMTDMKGNVALLGHTALMNEDEKYIVNQRVGLLRPKNSVGIDYPYLYILTNSTLFIEDLRSRANSGVQVNLSTSEIRNTKIIIPDFQTNSAFDHAVKPFFLRLFNSQKENHSLRTIRDNLLPKLISGELEVSENSLEPTF
jgi:type I restriction enzyme S subunit